MSVLLFTVEWSDQIARSTCLGPGFEPSKDLKIVRGTPLKLVFPDGTALRTTVKKYPKHAKIAPITIKENYMIPRGTEVWLDNE